VNIPSPATDVIANPSGARIAVVGASNNPDKYGNKIVRTLVDFGFSVIPVNPSDPEIAGLKACPDVNAAPGPVDLVNFVTPPSVTARVLDSMDAARFPVVWFQDGSSDEACLELARAKFGTVVHGACIMVAVRLHASAQH